MKIYTKTGDKGTTALIGGKRVDKNDLRVTTYGTVDELNSFIGLAMTTLESTSPMYKTLQTLQHTLFDLGADLATPDVNKAIRITENHVHELETSIDHMSESLPPLKSFILPGGGVAGAHLHVARTIARRAERHAVQLAKLEAVNPQALSFLNRLSDYLFIAARYAAHMSGIPEHLYNS